jgi:hypothetical protein
VTSPASARIVAGGEERRGAGCPGGPALAEHAVGEFRLGEHGAQRVGLQLALHVVHDDDRRALQQQGEEALALVGRVVGLAHQRGARPVAT